MYDLLLFFLIFDGLVTNEHRRGRIMPGAISEDGVFAMIGIAVDTAVSASIIGPDIHALNTAAAAALALVPLPLQRMPKNPFYRILINAGRGTDSFKG